jgi:hypothetical protein
MFVHVIPLDESALCNPDTQLLGNAGPHSDMIYSLIDPKSTLFMSDAKATYP